MESEKENTNKKKLTKIPVPMDPLPAIPQHLLRTKFKVSEVQRVPLRTLMQSNCEPSSSKGVLNDHKIDTTMSSSDKENDKRDVKMKIVGRIREKYCIRPSSAATPTWRFLEGKGVKNIKRSLKLPHSRELQGLTPAQQQEKTDEKVKRKLFNESLEDRLLSPDFWKKSYMTSMNRDYTDDGFKYLLSVETKPFNDQKNMLSSIRRACVVNWLMQVNGPNGNPATVQAACWYLDSWLSTGNKLNKLQVSAAACYCIAMKLHGPVISASKLVECSNNAFTAVELIAVEKCILQRLKFLVQPVVPQEFIKYLAWWCDNSNPREIEVSATFICLSGLMVDSYPSCDEYPSVIAAAAVSNALRLLSKQNLTRQLESFPMFIAAAKKTVNMSYVCSVQRKAVRTIDDPVYEYKTPLEHYGQPPNRIAQKIINAANEPFKEY